MIYNCVIWNRFQNYDSAVADATGQFQKKIHHFHIFTSAHQTELIGCSFDSSWLPLILSLGTSSQQPFTSLAKNMHRTPTFKETLFVHCPSSCTPAVGGVEGGKDAALLHMQGALHCILKSLLLEIIFQVCNARNVKVISKLSYTKGVVIVKCDGCQNNHLIGNQS